MRPHHLRPLLALSLALLASTVAAQSPAESTNSNVAPVMAATTLQYKSAISTYQPYIDQPVQSWRDANDRVGRIGGWRAYAKESSEPQSPDASSTADPHSSHHVGEEP